MKNILIILFLLILNGALKAQTYPITQNIGSTSTLLDIRGGGRVGGAFVLGHFTDTTAANAVSYVKNYANGMITTDTNQVWLRSYNAQRWIQFFTNNPNPTGDTLVWKLSGNTVGLRQATPVLGTLDGYDLNIITDGTLRFAVPSGGLVRNMAATVKYLSFDTITKQMYYGDGGSGSTPTWQQTLTEGANRTAAVSSSGSNLYDFTFDSTQFKVKGVYGSGQTIVSFTNSQMFFNPRKGAFRAGFASGTQWINSNVGDVSFASGAETIASGHHSTAMGSGSVASGTYSVAIGNTNIASGTSSLAIVQESVSSGDASAAIGLGLKSKSFVGFVVGSYNDSTNAANQSGYNSANRVFQVGIGSEDAARANAMTILYSGNVGIGTTSPSQLLHVNGIAQIGTAGSTLGQLNISGNTSGTITIKPQAAAGTYNFNLPTTAGTSGYFLTSGGGSGTAMTWTDPASISLPYWPLTGSATLTGNVDIDMNSNVFSLTNPSGNGTTFSMTDGGGGSAYFDNTAHAIKVGINTSSPAASAVLDVTSTTGGALMPRMTTTERNAISSPATGLEIFNTTVGEKQFYDGTRWVYTAHPKYEVYSALLTQSGTSAPTATVLENTLGGTVVWTRETDGRYVATLSGAFTSGKTFIPGITFHNENDGLGIWIYGYRVDANTIKIEGNTNDGGSSMVDSQLDGQGASIEIRVYY